MADYVAGFMFSEDRQNVVLVRKNRPEWQAGKLNGVGGKIEENELPGWAMEREFMEETGYFPGFWTAYAVVEGDWGSVVFFKGFGDVTQCRTMEDEKIEIWPVDMIPYDECIPNLSFLIPLALYERDTYKMPVFKELFTHG